MSAGYEVGYGKPPRHTRFQKGRSGNPKGRPKGAKSLGSLLARLAHARVTIVENGRRKRLSKLELAATQLINKAASGSLPHLKMLVALFAQIGNDDPAAPLAGRGSLDPEALKALSDEELTALYLEQVGWRPDDEA